MAEGKIDDEAGGQQRRDEPGEKTEAVETGAYASDRRSIRRSGEGSNGCSEFLGVDRLGLVIRVLSEGGRSGLRFIGLKVVIVSLEPAGKLVRIGEDGAAATAGKAVNRKSTFGLPTLDGALRPTEESGDFLPGIQTPARKLLGIS
jgi:hypothetical protein